MSSENKSELHKNHRERLRERFINDGIESFEDHQILELLLFHSITRSDTNPTAHRLLERFGSLDGVLCAGPDELIKVKGIGKKSAQLISTVAALSKQCELEKLKDTMMYQTIYVGDKKAYIDTAGAQAYFERYMWGYGAPDSAVIFIDKDKRLISAFSLSCGKTLSTQDLADEILSYLGNKKIPFAMLAHRHRCGKREPSLEDIVTTKAIDNALKSKGVLLIESFIVTDRIVTPFYDKIKEKSDTENDS